MPDYTTPGVYVKETSAFPSSVAQVETAIPAFIGYTEKAIDENNHSLLLKPKRIGSLVEYEQFFGKAVEEEGIKVNIEGPIDNPFKIEISNPNPSKFLMYYALQLFFANGGHDCFVISVGDYTSTDRTINKSDLLKGLKASKKIDGITLYVYPDAQGLETSSDFYQVYHKSLETCAKLQDRFTIMDIWQSSPESDLLSNVATMRTSLSPSNEDTLKYGAAYVPNLETSINYHFNTEEDRDSKVTVKGAFNGTLAELKTQNKSAYSQVILALKDLSVEMPPASAIAGVYARVDHKRGVWKAPANVSINLIKKPVLQITDQQQDVLNVDTTTGISVNAIRSFAGRGSLLWGARTLAGNNNEWRYVPVRRFFNMVEESIKKATALFVFEPNDANTWATVKSMIENFLTVQWGKGALQGTTPEKAFFVKVGLNETMTKLDIQEGRMIIEIGMAVVRPAEFIILRFSHKMVSE